ncbi:hypothetical protein P7H20_10555 [Paenibacillus larvae]|nr:hypothetical protein [Paenibacillus larvae]MDT2275191.1 hypothetical protein [Paenibacillus larvae]
MESGVYTFTINPHCFAHIQLTCAKDQEIQLEAGKSYPFVVAYFGNPMTEQEEAQLQLDVHYTFNQQETKEIEVETFLFLKSFLLKVFQWVLILERGDKLPDTDEDGIVMMGSERILCEKQYSRFSLA